jgi:hypothetical protein
MSPTIKSQDMDPLKVTSADKGLITPSTSKIIPVIPLLIIIKRSITHITNPITPSKNPLIIVKNLIRNPTTLALILTSSNLRSVILLERNPGISLIISRSILY